jgi:hypothetical protein
VKEGYWVSVWLFFTYLCLLFSDDSMPVAGDKGGDNRIAEGRMLKAYLEMKVTFLNKAGGEPPVAETSVLLELKGWIVGSGWSWSWSTTTTTNERQRRKANHNDSALGFTANTTAGRRIDAICDKKIGGLVFLWFLEDNETSAVAKSPRASYQRSNKPARVDEGSSSSR